jgi:hypothetical protein
LLPTHRKWNSHMKKNPNVAQCVESHVLWFENYPGVNISNFSWIFHLWALGLCLLSTLSIFYVFNMGNECSNVIMNGFNFWFWYGNNLLSLALSLATWTWTWFTCLALWFPTECLFFLFVLLCLQQYLALCWQKCIWASSHSFLAEGFQQFWTLLHYTNVGYLIPVVIKTKPILF